MPSAGSPPPPWPAAALEAYVPIRVLAEGGFGSVYLAKKKNVAEGERDEQVVAMKMIGRDAASTPSHSEAGYARREVEILSELSHPRIVKLLDTFCDDNGVPRCIALSLARGPTLELMLKRGGALGLPMAKEITKQLVGAISYLHSRAVIHRDIKPDNVVVSGAKPTAEECYSDGIDGEAAAKSKKWNIILIDFGFARALKPSEIDTDQGLYKVFKNIQPDVPEKATAGKALNPAIVASLDAPIDDGSTHGKSKRGRKSNLDRSMSRQIVRDLSALGQRSYAAPEIKKGVRQFSLDVSLRRRRPGGDNSEKEGGRRGDRGDKSGNKPLAECVSDYGMVADAFSLGATIRYMLTGIPPHIAVDEFIANQKSPIVKVSKTIGGAVRKLAGKEKKRAKKYRSIDELPPEAGQLVHALTHWDQSRRTTVRGALRFAWIADGLDDVNTEESDRNTVTFLQCALPKPIGDEIEEPQ